MQHRIYSRGHRSHWPPAADVGAVCLRVAHRCGTGECNAVVGRVRRSRHPAKHGTLTSETDARPASGQQFAGGYRPTPAHAAAHNPEPLQRAKTSRTPQQAAVHADGHHLRCAFTLFIQHVKIVFQVSIKLLGGIKPRAVAKRMSFASSV